ncbi:MAG TPA: hypothetical protein VFF39_05290 [Verrucomicrobiae bacterium]|nr:hypothetical protein [Verrucomicrobiae bacterium]
MRPTSAMRGMRFISPVITCRTLVETIYLTSGMVMRRFMVTLLPPEPQAIAHL